jgi:hypothetical protein
MKITKPEDMTLWAWVGDDDGPEGDGGLGIKQGVVPAGVIPMVACRKEKMTQAYIVAQMNKFTKQLGKKRYLARFKFDGIEMETLP